MPGPEPSSPSEAAQGAPRVVVERPEPGLARGQYAWPAWAVAALGTTIVLAALALLLWRLRRRSS